MNFLLCLIIAIGTVGLIVMFVGLIAFLMEINAVLGTVVMVTLIILLFAIDIYIRAKE